MRSSHEIVALMMTMFSFTPVAASAATGAPPADTEPPVSPTKPATLVVSTFDGEAQLHFDAAVISEEYLGDLAGLAVPSELDAVLDPIENWQMFLRNHGIDEIVEAHGC